MPTVVCEFLVSSHLGSCGMAKAFSVPATSAMQSRALPSTFLSSFGDSSRSTARFSTGTKVSGWPAPKLRHRSLRL